MILLSIVSIDTLIATAAIGAYLLSAVASKNLRAAASRKLVVLAWALHAASLLPAFSGAEPRFGFAAALSMTAWLAALVYAVEIRLYPNLQTHWGLSVFASIAVLLPLIFPGRALHLGESVWLPLHWALGIASYGLVAVAVFHAWLVKIAEGHIRHATHVSPGIPLMTLERLTFRFVQASFLLLTATIVVALLFGESLYGKTFQFRWNHKTFFSVLAWLTFGVLLIGRAKLGWRGQTAYRVLYAGSGMLLLAYAGSRFVLEILLKR